MAKRAVFHIIANPGIRAKQKLKEIVHKRALILGFEEKYLWPVYSLTKEEFQYYQLLTTAQKDRFNGFGRLPFVELTTESGSKYRLYWDGQYWKSSLYNQPTRFITRVNEYRRNIQKIGYPPTEYTNI